MLKILKSAQVKEVDSYTIDNEPVLSVNLMERAANQCSQWIINHFDSSLPVNVFVGPGNNGGDGLAIARQLADNDYHVKVFLVKISDKLSEDANINYERLKNQNRVRINIIEKGEKLPEVPKGQFVIDALFGSGLNRPLEGFPAEVVRHLNQLEVRRLAIDIPSGLFGEDNSSNDYNSIFRADYTLTFQFPGMSFFFPEHEDFVGEWHVLDIGLNKEKIDKIDSPFYLIEREDIRRNLKSRKRFAHKGHFGHVLMICGGYGKMGASVLASRAALRTGSGLVTAHVPKLGYSIMQTAAPEVMMSIDDSDTVFSKIPEINNFTAVGTGPGLGMSEQTKEALTSLFQNSARPIVIDADALNIISEKPELLKYVPENSILTPHPKEFERLAGPASDHYSRIQLQMEFAQKHKVILVLKGGNTTIATPEGNCYFNITGDPGMATAGSGDVLTGMITSLLGQGYSPEMASMVGVYLHGLAGSVASQELCMEAVTATDIINNTGNAFKLIRNEDE
jgi:NAD(P)H-hydrate epimerase